MTLEAYLRDVTARFPPDTAERIRQDLEEHALAHMDELQKAGHPDPEGAALAALGSVSEVYRALEQQHYTLLEETELLSNSAYQVVRFQSLVQILLYLPMWLAFPFLNLLLDPNETFSWGGYAAYILGVLLFLALDWWIPRSFACRSARVLLGLLRSLWVPHMLIAMQLVWLDVGEDLWAGVVGTLVGLGVVQLYYVRSLWGYASKALRNAH